MDEGSADTLAQQTADLCRRACSGNVRAQQLLQDQHDPRVRTVITALRIPPHRREEYVAVGREGLFAAAQRFDPARAPVLWPYARYVVRRYLIAQLGAECRLSAHQVGLYKRVWRTYESLYTEQQLATPPEDLSATELATLVEAFRVTYGFGMLLPTAQAILKAWERPRSLSETLPYGFLPDDAEEPEEPEVFAFF